MRSSSSNSLRSSEQSASKRKWWKNNSRTRSRVGPLLKRFTVGLAATFIYLALGEAAVRLALHSPFNALPDLRGARAGRSIINQSIDYDPVVGWVMKPFIKSKGFNTIELGMRSNGGGVTSIREGGVLTVGSSFTAGSEVLDGESWPATLEMLSGLPVNNAGVGGYSADQIMLRAEQLIPLVKPKTIIVDLLADNIFGVRYSSYGAPKPYFSIEDGKLVARNSPVPAQRISGASALDVKSSLAKFAVIDRFMAAFFPDDWLSSGRVGFEQTSVDEVEVTCRLLDNLKRKTEQAQIRLLLYLQFAGSHIIGQSEEPIHSMMVRGCAEKFGIQVVDEFDRLMAVYKSNPAELRSYYVIEPDGTTGHKSPFGNRKAADLIRGALSEQPIEVRSQESYLDDVKADRTILAETKNLVPQPEALNFSGLSTPHALLECKFNWFSGVSTYGLRAVGPVGEHYIGIGGMEADEGYMVFSLEAKADLTSKFRIQLISADGYGVLGDVDLKTSTAVLTRLGQAQGIASGLQQLSFGWQHIWIRAAFPLKGPRSIIIQLADKDSTYNFSSKNESILMRRLQVTQGRKFTPYASDAGILRRILKTKCHG